jgi:putative ABC transport system permease protein
MRPPKTPLARRNLLHNWRRLLAAVLGIGFAVVLMFMQTGFMNALFDSTVRVIEVLDADLILVNRAQQSLSAKQVFDHRRIQQARGCPGVEGVYPLYIEAFYAIWKPVRQKGYPIRTLAFELGDPVFLIPEVDQYHDLLRAPCTALIDSRSKPKFGIPSTLEEVRRHRGAELADRSIRLVGTFRMGTDFANDGNLIMSAGNFAHYLPFRAQGADPLSVVDLGLVRLESGADVDAVKHRLEEILPGDVVPYTKQELIRKEKSFWARSTPIGYIFGTGTVMGFVVGVIICYQVVYSSISDQVAEFATLRAMGYRDRYFVGLVFTTALYLSVLSFIPGLLISLVLYRILAAYTGLLLLLSFWRVAFVFILTLAMCSISGCLAVRKVLAADPADLY